VPKSLVYAHATLNAARAVAVPAWTPYLAIFVGDPEAGGIEAGALDDEYARQPMTLTVPSNYASTNVADIIFPTTAQGYGTFSHFGVMDALTLGVLKYSQLAPGTVAERTIGAGKFVRIPAGLFILSER
jgi:hypothetical protein